MEWYLKVLRQYAHFEGRARRREYWYFALFNLIVAIVLAVVDGVLGITLLSPLYSLAVLIPGVAVSVRRLHDTGRSGWWLLVSLLPLVGAIVLLVVLCLDSESGSNQYGPSPKQFGATPVAAA
jgi:uncharacterized membrane protein YhaH (DUF805 family)